jgi:hypothetical protein
MSDKSGVFRAKSEVLHVPTATPAPWLSDERAVAHTGT